MSFITRMAESIADGIYTDGNGVSVEYLMLTNREAKPFSPKAIDDHGGYAKGPFARHVAAMMEQFIRAERERHETAISSLDAIGGLE